MANLKDILVITSSTIEGTKIKKYLKPVSSHVVAGTNMFSDFFASFTDVFGGRSQSYQKQLNSLYNEAIEKIKYAAHELGANAVIGLSINIDEISGKNKAMFMITAIGTAVVLEDIIIESQPFVLENNGSIGIDRLNVLRTKKEFLHEGETGNFNLNEEAWSFFIANKVHEVFPYIQKKFSERINSELSDREDYDKFYKNLLKFIDALPYDRQLELLYTGITQDIKGPTALRLSEIVKDFQLFDFDKIIELLNDERFDVQKRAVRLCTYDKPFYESNDVLKLTQLRYIIGNKFQEKGTRLMKKQLLSSKEKEMWSCECGKVNDINSLCSDCTKDIYGFKPNEVSPLKAIASLNQKVELITECLN